MKKVVVVVGPNSERRIFEGNDLKVTNTKTVLFVKETEGEGRELGVFKVWRYWYEVTEEKITEEEKEREKFFHELQKKNDELEEEVRDLKKKFVIYGKREFERQCKEYNAPKSIDTPEKLKAFIVGLKLAEERRIERLP